MSNQIIPFESASLPAHFANVFGAFKNDLASGGLGFPVVSIKGKVFHVKRGDDKSLITKGDDGEPASSIEVVIIKAYPEGGKTAKVWYATGYTEGSDASPTCYSNDGVAPAADAADPQSSKCATCARAVWGSKISEDGKKNKECSDAKRLAIATPDALNDPMLIRVPAASLKALTQYGDLLGKRGVPYQAVVTKIGFDYTVAHPALTFKPVGFISEQAMVEVAQVLNSDVVSQIVGLTERPAQEQFDSPKPVAAKPAPAKAAPAPVDDDLPPPVKRVTVQVDGAPAPTPAPVKAPPAPKPAAAPVKAAVVEDVDTGMAATLDDLDFDD
jgi:hypothetical protein